MVEFTCCFTGHRPEKMPFTATYRPIQYAQYLRRIQMAIDKKRTAGCRDFYCGVARGFDLWAAQVLLKIKSENPNEGLRLICVVPFENFYAHWQPEDYHTVQTVLDNADEVICLQRYYSRNCFVKRNHYMVDNCGHVIAGYDGQQKGGTFTTIAYARANGRQVEIVNPLDV